MSRRTVGSSAIDWASRMDFTTAPLSAAQASGVAFFRALRLPPSAPMPAVVARMLMLGSPHLALAHAHGVPFGPVVLSIPIELRSRAAVGRTSSAVTMPTIVNRMAVRIVSKDASDVEFAVLDLDGCMSVKGNPQYVSSNYVRLDSLIRVVNSMPDSWILTKGQEVEMRVRSNRRMRAPITVYFALWCFQPILKPEHPLFKLSMREALEALEQVGYDVPEAFWAMMKEKP
jgi:hypothetical protein